MKICTVESNSNESERETAICERAAPNLYGIKLTHSEVDIEKAITSATQTGDGVNSNTVCQLPNNSLDTRLRHETESLDDSDTDSDWSLGEEWRYAHPHPGRRIV